jgi:hypothetical protein
MNRIRWSIAWCVASACASPPPSAPPPPCPPALQLPPRAVQHDPKADAKAEAARVLRAYADSHAFGAERRPPTPAEVAAAELADPIDAATDRERWAHMDTGFRLLEVYLQGQRSGWVAACDAAVEQWWGSARRIDEELEARLASQPPPTDFYAGIVAWSAHRQWLDARTQRDPAFAALPSLANVGAVFHLVTAQNAWAVTWLARDRPLEQTLGQRPLPYNAWAIEDLPTEQARFCKAAYPDSSGGLIAPTKISVGLKPNGPAIAEPAQASGVVAQVSQHGTEWVVTRRDWTATIESVPPCKRVMCTGIDCGMVEGGPWREVCAEKVTRHHEDHRWVLHFDTVPTKPRLGDAVGFYLDPATGHAVLIYASRSADVDPYFYVYYH